MHCSHKCLQQLGQYAAALLPSPQEHDGLGFQSSCNEIDPRILPSKNEVNAESDAVVDIGSFEDCKKKPLEVLGKTNCEILVTAVAACVGEVEKVQETFPVSSLHDSFDFTGTKLGSIFVTSAMCGSKDRYTLLFMK